MRDHEDTAVRDAIAAHIGLDGAALPILHDVQARLGYVPEAAVPVVADALNVSRAEMHGIVTFYHDFRDQPAGRHVLKLCRAEACQAMGGRGVADDVRDRLGIDFGETTADGRLTLEATYCLGLCATAPAAMMDGRLVGRIGAAAIDRLVAQALR